MTGTKFNVNIIGILFNPQEKKILVGKNKDAEKFSFVDGELKYDEELDFGLKRVVNEKTGYEVHNLGVVFANNNIDEKATEDLELYFLCEVKGGSESSGANVEELRWIKAHEHEDLSGKKLPKRLREYIQNICGN